MYLCCKWQSECNGYDTFTDILYIQPQSLFSISIYIHLLSDFLPFTIINVQVPYYFTIEQGPMYLVNLRVKFPLPHFTLDQHLEHE